MKYHTTDPASLSSAEDIEDSVIAESWLFPREGGGESTQFDHIFAENYAVGFRSYEYGEALAADILEKFRQKGIYDRENADRLRATIFAGGGTVAPMSLFRAMMGREPDMNAIFRQRGLSPG